MPLSMTADELALWTLVLGHRGRAAAITQANAAAEIGWYVHEGTDRQEPDTRRLQEALRSLRIVHGKLIGSACSPPYGIYLCVTDAEVKEYRGQLVSRLQEAVDLLHACDVDALRRFQREHPDIDLNPTPTPRPPRRRCSFCHQAWAKPGSDYCGGSCEWMHKLPSGNQRKTA